LTDADVGRSILEVWLTTEFAGGRHARRLDKIAEMEARQSARESGR